MTDLPDPAVPRLSRETILLILAAAVGSAMVLAFRQHLAKMEAIARAEAHFRQDLMQRLADAGAEPENPAGAYGTPVGFPWTEPEREPEPLILVDDPPQAVVVSAAVNGTAPDDSAEPYPGAVPFPEPGSTPHPPGPIGDEL